MQNLPNINGALSFKTRNSRRPKHYLVLVKKVSARSNISCLKSGSNSADFGTKIRFSKNLEGTRNI
jgi:hypothetical protein